MHKIQSADAKPGQKPPVHVAQAQFFGTAGVVRTFDVRLWLWFVDVSPLRSVDHGIIGTQECQDKIVNSDFGRCETLG